MFVRLFRPHERKEILFNVNNVWKIEVMYGVGGGEGMDYWRTGLDEGLTNPAAIRFYKIFIGSEEIFLAGDDPNDPVLKVFTDIYKNAVKGIEQPPDADTNQPPT